MCCGYRHPTADGHSFGGGDATNLAAGTTVFGDATFDGTVSYYLESDPEFGGDGSCYVWGADVTYYDGLGCSAL